jgi:hypothetical protein
MVHSRYRGDTIKRVEVLLVVVTAILTVPIMAQNDGLAGGGSVAILGTGIFETEGSALKFPDAQDTNIDLLTVGNDRALAIGHGRDPIAANNLLIKKNQDSGECKCCDRIIDKEENRGSEGCSSCSSAAKGVRAPKNVSPCHDCCIKLNLEDITVGNRDAMAFGSSSADNYVKIVTNQQ